MINFNGLLKRYICIIFCIMLSFDVIMPYTAIAYENKKSILIINSYHKGYKWSDDIISGIEATINTSKLDTDVDVEYMDSLRTSGQEYLDELYEIYKYKYSNKKLDVVICSDDAAYNFVLKYENDIFKNVPIVFCGVNYFDKSQIAGNKMVTGIVENYDIEANLDLILKIHPNTKNVYVINDNTITGQGIGRKLNEVIPKYKDKLSFIDLTDCDKSEIVSTLNKPLENSVGLFLVFFQDSTGHKFNYDESVKLFSEDSLIPIYGAWEFSLGNGIVGGMLTSGYYQGKTAAEISLRIIEGEMPSNIPVVDYDTNEYMFDYSEMKRFGIEQSNLPPDSYIINKHSNEKKQILLLNSYNNNMKWTSDIVNGIKNVLDDKKYDLSIDYMDAKGNYAEEYREKIENLLKYKYKDKQFDLVITSDDEAYEFVNRYHSKLFQNIPLVFCGINSYTASDRDYYNTTGVVENIDVKKTLELALSQNPGIKHIVVINDDTLTGQANKAYLKNVLPEIIGDIDYIFYEDKSMTEIQKSVSELKNDTLVYLLSFNRDKSNNIFSDEESTELIASKSSVPVYGAWDFNLNHGIVGGLLANGESQGKIAGEMSLKILNGENINNIPVIKENTNKYMFDYNQLKKYKIYDTPKGSVIINTPQIFNVSRATLVVILVLILPIVLILVIVNYKNINKARKNIKTINELEISASLDFLTGTYNRSAGIKFLNKLLHVCDEEKSRFSLCFIDLNNLKIINDTFGHNEGDNYIKTTVEIIQKGLDKNHIFFRFGGDEFIILFPKTRSIEATEILKNINNYFDEYNEYNNAVNYKVSISYGISEYNPHKPLKVEELIDIADKEMYLFKSKLKMQRNA